METHRRTIGDGPLLAEPVDAADGTWRGAPGEDGGGGGLETRVARGLGWFSIALGLAEVAAPRGLARLVGVRAHPALVRALGVREIASGVGILTQRRPAPWLWSRVGGDVIDLALLGSALTQRRTHLPRAVAATAAVAGVTLVDVLSSQRLTGATPVEPVHVRKTVTVNRPADELYRHWQDLGRLPGILSHVQSVERTGPGRSRWRVRGPRGTAAEWEAELFEDRPTELLAWRSLPDAPVATRGGVRFKPAPGGRGTEVTVELEYAPGVAGLDAAALQEDLRRFKRTMETGEVPTTLGQPQGPAASRVLARLMRGRS